MTRPPCYQCTEDLDAIREKSNADIRAWGKKQLYGADLALLGVPTPESFDSDWDVITDPEPDPDLIQIETETEVPAKEPSTKNKKIQP